MVISDKVKFQPKNIRQRSIFYTDKSMVYKQAISALNLFAEIKNLRGLNYIKQKLNDIRKTIGKTQIQTFTMA